MQVGIQNQWKQLAAPGVTEILDVADINGVVIVTKWRIDVLGQEGPVSFRDQFAVNGDERLIGIGTLKIQTIGNVVFAGAAFAENHDRTAAGIHFMQRRIQVGSLCRQAEKAGKIIALISSWL